VELNELLAALETLRRHHYVCDDDGYYSCSAVDYEGIVVVGKGCNCGAFVHNTRLDVIIEEVKRGIKG